MKRVGGDAIHELPGKFAHLLFALGVPEEVLAVLGDGDIRVHAATIDADDRLRQEAGGETHAGGNLTTDQFVDLDLVGSIDHVGVAIVDLELRGRNFRVILLVLKAHRALHFGGSVDELAQGVAGQGVVVATGVHVLEFVGLVVATFGIGTIEEEAFNFVGCVQGVAIGSEQG